MLRIEIFEDNNKELRWRAIERNGRVIATSAEGYVSLQGVERAVINIVDEMRGEVTQVRRANNDAIKRRAHGEESDETFATDHTFPSVNIAIGQSGPGERISHADDKARS
jgi:uncharacterized protein YegP (UPF0339 family)